MYVEYALAAYRNTQHSSTKHTPFYLMYGREYRLPVATDLECTLEVKPSINELKEKLEEASVIAREATERARQQNKIRYDKGKKLLIYQPGDFVYYYQPSIKLGVASKFAHPWTGPYRIISKLGDRNYILRVGENNVTVFVDRIKPYRGDSEDVSLDNSAEQISQETSLNTRDVNDTNNCLEYENEMDTDPWIFPEPMIEIIELPENGLGNYEGENSGLNESSETEIDDHRDVDFDPPANIQPTELDGPAYRTRAKVRET